MCLTILRGWHLKGLTYLRDSIILSENQGIKVNWFAWIRLTLEAKFGDDPLVVTLIVILTQLMTNVPHHIETSQLICIANQLTGFYMIENIGR